jgi:hypothetical protein
MRKLVITLAAAGVVAVAIPFAVLAAASSGREGGSLDRQVAAWRTAPVERLGTSWSTIGGLSFVPTVSAPRSICMKKGFSVSLTVTLKGAPAYFRLLMDGGPVLAPLGVRFDPRPGGRPHTFAATFVGHAGTFEGSDLHGLEVQWRSPSGRAVTLVRGAANVLYQQGSACS